MLYKIFKPLTFTFIILAFGSASFAQNIIDYSTSGLPTALCNVFNTSTPATVGGYTHYPVSGGVSFDGSKLVLNTQYGTTSSSNYGTAYAIQYPFTAGYSYVVKITGYGVDGSGGVNLPAIAAYLFSALPDPNQTNPVSCGAVDQSRWSAVQTGRFVGNDPLTTTSSTYTLPSTTPSANNSYLVLLASGGSTSPNKGYISKITITATAPTPSFTLTPSTINKACGTALSQTFTVNNVNGTAGVTSYNWNLGSATNGWNVLGSPAPQTFGTSSNSITLTAAACVSGLQNVTASAVIGSTSYTTNTSAVAKSSPAMSLSGPSPLCTTGSFSISNVPCNSTVSWVSSNTNVATVPASGNPVTVTKVNAGTVTITATVNACSQAVTLSKTIHVGGYSSGDYVLSGPSSACAFQTLSYSVNILPGATGYTWIYPSSFSYYNGGNGNSYLTVQSGTSTSGGGIVGVKVANACDAGGSYSTQYVSVNSCGAAITASPNPTTDNVTVTVVQEKNATSANNKKAMVYQLKLTDQSGNVKKQYKYAAGISNTNISLKGLMKGMYTIQAFDGTTWSSVQVIKQ